MLHGMRHQVWHVQSLCQKPTALVNSRAPALLLSSCQQLPRVLWRIVVVPAD
jgi:hypothetical protein